MSRLQGIRARLHSLFGVRAAERRMEEEFRFHVDMETRRGAAEGLPEGEAKRRALMAFGGLDHYREAMRDGRGARLLDDLWADVRYALRGMRRSPGFAVATALTLGVGIGVNGIIFGFVNSLLFRPLPAHDPQQLVGVFTINARSSQVGEVAYEDYLDLRDRSGAFDGVAGRTDGPVNLVVPRGANENPDGGRSAADMVWGEFVTENYFTVLAMKPALGRFFAASDAPQGSNPFAVISFDSWQHRFHSDSTIVGRVVRLNGTEFTVTGVAPPGFRGLRTFGFWPEIWAPIGMHNVLLPGSAQLLQGRGDGWMILVGRMHAGWTQQRTAAATARFAQQLQQAWPATNRDMGLMLIPAATGFDHPGFVKQSVLQLSSALGLFAATVTLLIISANLANLQLARSKARAREIAIRLSLGCSRVRLTRQLLVESLILAIPGAALAVAVIFTAPRLESLMVPHLQFRVGFNPVVDATVIGYTAGVALLAVALFGLAPALRASRPDLAPSLVSVVGSRRRGAGSANGMRASLVISQLALSVVLLVAGTLFVRSLLLARAVDVGFDASDRVLTSLNLSLQGYDIPRGRRAYQEVVDRLREIPGVDAVSWAFPVPFDTYGRGLSLYVEGIAGNAKDQTISTDMTVADVDFVEALGLRLNAGRSFSVADSAGAPSVMLVSSELAGRLWPGKDPVGQRARLGSASGREITVIGVIHDAKFATIGENSHARAYLPLRQNYTGWETLVVHARRDPAQVVRDVQGVIAAVDPALPTFGATTMAQSVESGFSTHETAAGIGGFFGLLALLIAAIGLYAVVAGSVAERTREIGLRMALGATPRGVMRFVMRGGARLGLVGLGIGLAGAIAVATLMRGILVGLSPHDPLTFVIVPIVLGVVVFFATWLPARRAVRMDPVAALRSD
jgi:predicted permease